MKNRGYIKPNIAAGMIEIQTENCGYLESAVAEELLYLVTSFCIGLYACDLHELTQPSAQLVDVMPSLYN
jgi:hypothetical protein